MRISLRNSVLPLDGSIGLSVSMGWLIGTHDSPSIFTTLQAFSVYLAVELLTFAWRRPRLICMAMGPRSLVRIAGKPHSAGGYLPLRRSCAYRHGHRGWPCGQCAHRKRASISPGAMPRGSTGLCRTRGICLMGFSIFHFMRIIRIRAIVRASQTRLVFMYIRCGLRGCCCGLCTAAVAVSVLVS